MYREESAIKETRYDTGVVSFFKAMLFGAGFTIIAFLLCSALICYSPLGEGIIPTVSLGVTVISVFLSSALFSKGAKSRGYLKGAISGIFYVFIIYLMSMIFVGGFYFNAYSITLLAIGIFAGSFGGIMGINMKDKRRR